MERRDYPVSLDEDGTRLDRFIRRHHDGINQGKIEKLLRSGSIRVDGSKAKSSTRLNQGQLVTMPAALAVGTPRPRTEHRPDPAVVSALRDAVIARGKGWIAINKPSGLASQGGAGTVQHVDGALAEAFPGEGPPRLVHRLDRDTSGIMVVATSLAASRELARGFQGHGHQKTYLALVLGVPRPQQGTIDAPLIKAGGKGQEKMVVDYDIGQTARTDFTVLEAMGRSVSLVALSPLTGRTHQLRAHMATLGCPILGDGKYGGSESFPHDCVTRLCLHAAHLVLEGGEAITAPCPPDLAKIMGFFGVDAAGAIRRTSQPRLFGGGA